MRIRPALTALASFAVVFLFMATPAEAQLGKLKKAAQRGAENEAARQVEDITASAVACAFEDFECIEEAEESDQPVVYTDSEGRVITDDDGKPVTDREAAARTAGREPAGDAAGEPDDEAEEDDVPVRVGEGVWANYDFVRGDKILYAEDFEDDRVGNFPKRLEFVKGNMEVVEWEGRRFLRLTAASEFNIHLPEALPERFTVEFDFNAGTAHGSQNLFTSPVEAYQNYEGNWFSFNANPGVIGNGPTSVMQTYRTRDQLTAIRIHVDGQYAKVYLGEQRIANVPNATFPRSDVLYFRLTGRERNPTYIGTATSSSPSPPRRWTRSAACSRSTRTCGSRSRGIRTVREPRNCTIERSWVARSQTTLTSC